MTLIANKFLTVIPNTVSGPEAIANTLTRVYSNTRVEDVTTVTVYYNGQLIENSTVNPTGKFYYTVAATLLPSASDMTTTWIPGSTVPTDTSHINFTLFPNPAYTEAGYTGSPWTNTLSTTDTFVISYYYTIYTVA